jgi:2-keto-4-pentenoate hydratase
MPQSPCSAADFLLDLRLSGRKAPGLPPQLAPASLEDAYRIQAELVDKLIAHHGGRRIGYKIACTNVLAQRLLNVDAPLFGTLLSFSTHRAPARLPASAFKMRVIEAEFGFEMATDVPQANAPYTAQSILPFVGAAFPSIEIVDQRFEDWTRVGAATLIADNAIHGAWVEGAPCAAWRSVDFAKQPVALSVNARVAQTGSGAAVLGNPLNVVAWLANELPRRGRALRAGDKISTGVTTDIYLAEAGDELKAEFGALGSIELAFECG